MSTAWHVYSGGHSGSELEISYEQRECCPQYAVLHTLDGYLRFTYGPESVWGTSIAIMPCAWISGRLFQGVKVDVDWEVVDDSLRIRLSGSLDALTITETLTLRPPDGVAMVAHVMAVCSGRVKLDYRPAEAFKPVFLSSMHISEHKWDCCAAFCGDRVLPIPPEGSIIPAGASRIETRFGLYGGTSDWKTNGPSVSIKLDRPLQIGGWVTRSTDPNDDNVGFWAACDAAPPSWSYTIRADATSLTLAM